MGAVAIVLFFWIAFTAIVFFDARDRDMNPAAWAATVILFGPVGFVLYLIARLRHRPTRRAQCPECFGSVPAGARRCMHCGASVHA